MVKIVVIFISLLIGFQSYSQDSLKIKTIAIGMGAIYYPTGKIPGFSHNYSANYRFAKHFGFQIGLDFGNGQKNDKYYFDHIKSTVIHAGLIYIPFKNRNNLHLNGSFMYYKTTNIFGTKDEIMDSNNAMSKFTTYEKSNDYGLNLGFQFPIYETQRFIFSTKLDSWASWLQINAISLKFQIHYKITKQ